MIATIGTILFWLVVLVLIAGGLLCAFVGFMFLTSYSAWKR